MQEHLNTVRRLAGIIAVAVSVIGTMAVAGAMQHETRIPTQQVASVVFGRG